MKANELMIGDYFYRPDCVDRVVEIRKNGVIGVDSLRGLIPWSEISPITTTPEILENNGFTQEFVGDAYVLATDDFEVSVCFRRDSSVRALSVRTHTRIYEEKKITRAYAIHELQYALRLIGLTDVADNFKIS